MTVKEHAMTMLTSMAAVAGVMFGGMFMFLGGYYIVVLTPPLVKGVIFMSTIVIGLFLFFLEKAYESKAYIAKEAEYAQRWGPRYEPPYEILIEEKE